MIQSINQAGGGQGGGGDDEKVKVSANDTTEGYLNGKLVAGTNVTLTENNNGGNETLTVTATDTNDAAKVSANDTTAGFLNGKLVAGTNITFTENNDGSNETLTIAASGLTGFTASQNTASPNNTANASRLLVDAASTNADAVIQPKGTGALLAQLPDDATTGGNKRGSKAVDLQTSRTSASQVASGPGSVTIGRNNTASGMDATAIGRGNQVSGIDATAIGFGNQVSAQGAEAFVAGKNNTVQGPGFVIGSNNNLGIRSTSTILGIQNVVGEDCTSTLVAGGSNTVGSYVISSLIVGSSITVSGSDSRRNVVVTGSQASCPITHGVRVHAYGRFANNGDCQYERYILRRATTNATQTELSCDGQAPAAATRIGIANDSTYTFTALVTARRTDADNESAGYKIEGVIDNNAGTTAFVGTPTVTVLAEDTAAWDVVVEADDTNDALVIKVTGEDAKTIRWGAVVELMKVSG